jgi:hypothetical protein
MEGLKMPAFIFLIFLGAVLIWLLLSFAFVPLGKIAKRLWKDAKDAMNDYENEKTEERKD